MTTHKKQSWLGSRSLLVVAVVVASFLAAFLGQVLITALSLSPSLLPETGIIVRNGGTDAATLRKHGLAIVAREQAAFVRLYADQNTSASAIDAWVISNDGWVMSFAPSQAMRFVRLTSGAFAPIKESVDDAATGLHFVRIEKERLQPLTIAQSFDAQPLDTLISVSDEGLLSIVTMAGSKRLPQNDQKYSSDKLDRFPVVTSSLEAVGAALYNQSEELVCLARLSAGTGATSCIPAEQIRIAMSDVLRNGEINRPELGVSYIPVSGEGSGIEILNSSGAALKGGVRVGDIVTAVDGVPLSERLTLSEIVLRSKVGDSLELTVTRRGLPLTLAVTLQ